MPKQIDVSLEEDEEEEEVQEEEKQDIRRSDLSQIDYGHRCLLAGRYRGQCHRRYHRRRHRRRHCCCKCHRNNDDLDDHESMFCRVQNTDGIPYELVLWLRTIPKNCATPN